MTLEEMEQAHAFSMVALRHEYKNERGVFARRLARDFGGLGNPRASRHGGNGLALDGITAEVPAGATVAVLGRSGSGKSTLLALLGLLWDGQGTSGTLTFHDGARSYNLLRLSDPEKAALRSRAFGFVLQSNYLLAHFSCLDNLVMPLALKGWPQAHRERWATALLEDDGVDPVRDLRDVKFRTPRRVSMGQKQRFAALRAVIADPLVVFADEPSSALDPGATKTLFNLLGRWKQGDPFAGPREKLVKDPHTPQALRERVAVPNHPTTKRTLVLVTHDVHTARERATDFLLLNREHRLEAAFPRARWNDYAERIEHVMGLDVGEAGRDFA